MREALRICRDHGRDPAWWDGLPRGDRALLLADMRLRDHESRRSASRSR